MKPRRLQSDTSLSITSGFVLAGMSASKVVVRTPNLVTSDRTRGPGRSRPPGAGPAAPAQLSGSALTSASPTRPLPVRCATIRSPWKRPFSMKTWFASYPATSTPTM